MAKPKSYQVFGEFPEIAVIMIDLPPDGEDFYPTFEEAKTVAIKRMKVPMAEYEDNLACLEDQQESDCL